MIGKITNAAAWNFNTVIFVCLLKSTDVAFGDHPFTQILMKKTILLSLQVGMPKLLGKPGTTDPSERLWSTGIFKEPVTGPIWLGRTNLAGDGQADLTVHGGPDKAVLAYSAEHYPAWHAELKRDNFNFGAFGENFTIAGLNEDEVCVGDIYNIGESRVQVSQPRQPCWKLARKWSLPRLPARVVATGRSGWYLRVLHEGNVAVNQPVTLVAREFAQWPIRRVSEIIYNLEENRAAAERLAQWQALAESLRYRLAERVGLLTD